MNDELLNDNEDVYLTYGDKMVFKEVDNIVADAIAQGDPEIIMRFGRSLRKDARVRGVALAKLIWSVKDNWKKFQDAGIEDDLFSVLEGDMRVPPSTASTYIRIWEAVFANPDIPDATKELLLAKPIGTLKLLPALTTEGDVVDWDEIVRAHDKEEVRQIVKRIRGEATSSKTALFIKLDVRTGQLACKRGDMPFVNFGLLNLGIEDEVVKSAIERIVTSSRIMEV
jgi:hypothetical protein